MSFQKEYNSQLVSLLENSPSFYLIRLDLNARFTYVNPLFARTFSFISPDFTGVSFTTTLPTEDVDLYKELMDQLEVNANMLPIDIRHLHPGNSFAWLHWEFSAIKDVNGQVVEIMSIGYEVREKEQEKTIFNLQAIVDSTTDVSFFVNPTHHVLAFNRKAARNAPLLHARELQAGDCILDYMDAGQQTEFKYHFQKALQGDILFTEDEIRYNEALSIWFRTEYHPVKDQPGAVIGVVLHIVNIDERKKAEKQVMESESNLRAIIDNSDSLIWLINNQYQIIDYNSHFAFALQRFFGIELKRKQKVIDQLSDKYRLKWQQRYDGALKGHKGVYLDREKFKGKEYVLEVKTFPILIEGKVRGVSIYLKDISKQQQAERKLKRQNEQLKKVNTELDKLVYSASHDLRAPLMSILGLINISKLEGDEQAKAHYLELMSRSVHKLDSFIGDILNLSRNARLIVQSSEIDFQNLIDTTLDDLQYMPGSRAIEKRIYLQIEHPFYSDEKRLKVIFTNILSNSIRYMNEGQEKPWVEIKVRVSKEQAIIIVADNGIGIASAHVDKVFHMFYRASEQKAGSGLGLYIVKETVEKLKGKVSISSRIGSGTEIFLQLPNAK